MSLIKPQTPTTANVQSSASSVNIFAATALAAGRTVYNDSTAVLYLLFGSTASTTSYTVQIPSQGYFEFPVTVYCGNVDGIWASANGYARTTSW